jgi:hypothetical protein
LSRSFGLNLFNIIESATFHCFLQLGEEEEVALSKVMGVGRVWERRNIVFRQKFICGGSPVGRGIVMVQDPIAGVSISFVMQFPCKEKVTAIERFSESLLEQYFCLGTEFL